MNALDARLCSIEKIAEESDYIIVSLVYNKSTEKIINRRILELMKPNAMIVNIGRGGE